MCDHKGRLLESMSDKLYSKSMTTRGVLKDLCELNSLDLPRGRLWNYASSNPSDQHLLPLDLTLKECKIQDGQVLLFEVSLDDGTWPRSQLQQAIADPSSSIHNINSHTNTISDPKHPPSLRPSYATTQTASIRASNNISNNPNLKLNDGRVGLDNLGNTCYMNSSLQALIHTDLLSQYFLNDYYLKHINSTSKDGYQGRLARAYAKLVTDMRTTTKTEISPKAFYNEFTQLASQFKGNNQHDAQV